MLSVCKSKVHQGVDCYPGSGCSGGRGWDQHYGPLGMFSVYKNMVHRWVDRYPVSECVAAVVGINIMDLLVCSVCV
jgi:hypothetical protein